MSSNSFDAASTSQVRLKGAVRSGLMEKQRGNPSHQEEEDSEDSDSPEAETWYCKGEPVAQNSKALGATPCTRSQCDMEPLPPNIAEHISLYGSRLLHCQEILWKTTDPMKDLNVNLAIWRMFMNTTLRAAVHLGKRL